MYCSLGPGRDTTQVAVSAELTVCAAPGPTSALPRWLTSKRPTAVRVALCSLTVPAYETGISQPPNFGDNRTSSRWRSLQRSVSPLAHRSRRPTLMGVPTGTLRQVYDFRLRRPRVAGIANPRERPACHHLDELGFTVEEMVQAERRGRLPGLAGDVPLWSAPTLETAADEPLSADDVARAWSLLGPHRRGS